MKHFFKYIFISILFFQTCYAPTCIYVTNDTGLKAAFTTKVSGDKPLTYKKHYRGKEKRIKIGEKYFVGIEPYKRERILRVNRHKLPGEAFKKTRFYYDTTFTFYDEKGNKKGVPITLRQIVTVPSAGMISSIKYGIFHPDTNKFLEIEGKVVGKSKAGLHLFKFGDREIYVLGANFEAGTFNDMEYIFRLKK